MPIRRGKDFEKIIEKSLNEMPNVLCERLHDQVTGYLNVSRNPSDYIVYKYPYMYYLECKSIHGASIPLTNFKQQDLINERVKKSDGVRGVYLVWFVDKQITFWIPSHVIEYSVGMGVKSLNYTSLMTTPGVKIIPAEYKRIYGKYDFSKMFEE